MTKKCESEAKEGPRRNSQNCENNDKKRSKVYSPMFLFFAIKIYTAYFTYRTLDTSNEIVVESRSVIRNAKNARGLERDTAAFFPPPPPPFPSRARLNFAFNTFPLRILSESLAQAKPDRAGSCLVTL